MEDVNPDVVVTLTRLVRELTEGLASVTRVSHTHIHHIGARSVAKRALYLNVTLRKGTRIVRGRSW